MKGKMSKAGKGFNQRTSFEKNDFLKLGLVLKALLKHVKTSLILRKASTFVLKKKSFVVF
jgi:hypothetical protein